ncbi:MAG: HAMP domain-containing protein [Methanomicrobiales archaeon]|nr:HAMP domain-containing protein [Methanomicrobiales archaeon]
MAERNLEEQAQLLKIQTESTVIQELQIADDGLKLYDTTLNRQMQDTFTLVLNEYNRSAKDPARMDLESIKAQTGGLVDLYIINSSGVIEYTTFPPDRNLDFRKIPYFYSYLESIRISDGFFPDRIVIEPATGVLRKYAYMPTPDHAYIFELGLTGSSLENTRGSLKYHDRIHTLTSLNPYVKGFRIFTSRKQLEDNRSFIPDPELDTILTAIISERKGLEREILDAGERVSYLFVDLRDEQYGSDVSRIVEITYDESAKQAALNNLLLIHIVTAMAALALMSGIAILLARRINEPIREMAADADMIARGSLDHMISGDHDKQSHTSFSPHSMARKLRFSNYLLAYLLLIIGITVIGLTAVDLVNADATFRRDALTMQVQTEESLNQTIHLVDEGFKLYDSNLNKEMQTGFETFMAEYERAGRDVSQMDLESVKTKLGDLTDLYIINRSLIIEYTTFTPDLGLDFKQFPATKEYLTKIIEGEGFYPDRVVRETATGQFRKFAYMPTPDHQYILELGMLGPGIIQRHGKVGYQEAFESIVARNPYIVSTRFFDTTMHVVNNFTYRPDEEEIRALTTVIDSRSLVEIIQEEEHRIIRYLFIDLLDLDYASDMSWIIKLTYDSERINTALFDLLLFHAYIGLAALMMGIIGAIAVSRHLTRPVQQIVSDVEQVAKGDIDHQISPVRGSEFEVLERSINSMVATLKANIEQLQDSEMKLRQSEQKFRDLVRLLPQPVFEIDLEGKVLFANESAFEVFGYTENDLEKGIRVFDIIVPEQGALVRKRIQQVVQGIESKGVEYFALKKDGTRIQVVI